MKKFVSVLMLCVLMVSMVVAAALPVSAATPKEQLVACARENMPEQLVTKYMPAIENTLRYISVNQEQADQICDIIVETREYFESTGGYKGVTLHYYTREHQLYAVDVVAEICDILGLTSRYTFSTDADHDFDVVITIFDAQGRRLAILDGDAVKQTNTPYTVDYTYVVVAAALLLIAGAAAVVGKKLTAER